MAHGDAVGNRDRAEFARCAICRLNALAGGMGLTHQRRITGGGLVPARRDPDKRLLDVLGREPHRVIVGAVRCAFRAFRHMAGWQLGFVPGLGHVRSSVSSANRTSAQFLCGKGAKRRHRWQFLPRRFWFFAQRLLSSRRARNRMALLVTTLPGFCARPSVSHGDPSSPRCVRGSPRRFPAAPWRRRPHCRVSSRSR